MPAGYKTKQHKVKNLLGEFMNSARVAAWLHCRYDDTPERQIQPAEWGSDIFKVGKGGMGQFYKSVSGRYEALDVSGEVWICDDGLALALEELSDEGRAETGGNRREPGRPSNKSLIIKEHIRLTNDGECLPGKAAEAEALWQWSKSARLNPPYSNPRSIENLIRDWEKVENESH